GAAGRDLLRVPTADERRSHDGRRQGLIAVAFVAPYVALLCAFAVYPLCSALWMASAPSLYADLIADPFYLPTVVNTLLFIGFGVNVMMIGAVLLSGFFMRSRWWLRGLLALY